MPDVVTPFSSVEAIVFDSDGVLVDSIDSVNRAWRRWALEYGVDIVALLAEVHGRPARASVAAFIAPSLVDEAAARIDAYELADAATVMALPGAADLLASMPYGRWAIATSANRLLATARLAAAGLRVPEVMVTADDVRLGKPDPEVYWRALLHLGLDGARAAVFEDSASGIRAALSAGVRTVIRVGCGAPGPGVAAVVPDLRSAVWRNGLWIRH
jgi:sugar-phosphatase